MGAMAVGQRPGLARGGTCGPPAAGLGALRRLREAARPGPGAAWPARGLAAGAGPAARPARVRPAASLCVGRGRGQVRGLPAAGLPCGGAPARRRLARLAAWPSRRWPRGARGSAPPPSRRPGGRRRRPGQDGTRPRRRSVRGGLRSYGARGFPTRLLQVRGLWPWHATAHASCRSAAFTAFMPLQFAGFTRTSSGRR